MFSSGKIRENHYGRNIRFTRAVDELDIIRRQALAQIENERRNIEPVISLNRLTAQQISDAQNGNLSHWGIETSEGEKRTAKKEQKEEKSSETIEFALDKHLYLYTVQIRYS